MPNALDAFACGSRSTSSVARSEAAIEAARLTAVVVLPTPPCWLTTAKTRAGGAAWLAPARLSPQLIEPLAGCDGRWIPRVPGSVHDVPRGTGRAISNEGR